VTNDGDGLTFAKADAVEDFGMRDDFVTAARFAVEPGEDVEEPRDAAQSGENAFFFGDDGGGGAERGLDGERVVTSLVALSSVSACSRMASMRRLFHSMIYPRPSCARSSRALRVFSMRRRLSASSFSQAFDDVGRGLCRGRRGC
jgi:hypothetical protein